MALIGIFRMRNQRIFCPMHSDKIIASALIASELSWIISRVLEVRCCWLRRGNTILNNLNGEPANAARQVSGSPR